MSVSDSLHKYGQGAIAGVITVGALQPIFTVVNLTMAKAKIPAFHKTPLFFWRGLTPNLAAEVAFQALSLGTYSLMVGRVPKDHAAIISAVCYTPVLAFCERLMFKQQLFGGSSLDVVKKIIRTEGVRYLFKGVGPISVREVIFSHTLYCSSEKIGKAIHNYVPHKKSADITAQIGIGALCGFLTTPCQVVAVNMQSDETKMRMRDLISQVIKQDRVIGLFRGSKERAILISLHMVGVKQSQASVSHFFDSR